MVLRMVRVLLNEIVQVVSPWRRAPVGGNVLANQGGVGFAGVGSAGCDGHESEDLLGPLWFAVPKKRVPLGKKRTRTADRAPKRVTHYSLCTKCGQPKLKHKFCSNIELCASDGASATER